MRKEKCSKTTNYSMLFVNKWIEPHKMWINHHYSIKIVHIIIVMWTLYADLCVYEQGHTDGYFIQIHWYTRACRSEKKCRRQLSIFRTLCGMLVMHISLVHYIIRCCTTHFFPEFNWIVEFVEFCVLFSSLDLVPFKQNKHQQCVFFRHLFHQAV